jgi:hypothetical protein
MRELRRGARVKGGVGVVVVVGDGTGSGHTEPHIDDGVV